MMHITDDGRCVWNLLDAGAGSSFGAGASNAWRHQVSTGISQRGQPATASAATCHPQTHGRQQRTRQVSRSDCCQPSFMTSSRLHILVPPRRTMKGPRMIKNGFFGRFYFLLTAKHRSHCCTQRLLKQQDVAW